MSQLEDLLQACTVRITIPGQSGWGTGFFVATGLILTCNHVVRRSPQQVQVEWQNEPLTAVVERSIPDPYDLALLRVTLATEGHPPCVWLDEEVRSRDSLYLFGYPDQDFPNGCPVAFHCEGLTGDEPVLIKFALGQVRPGMSGSPLLNQRTGRVCGMVKFTRDRSSDLGGGAIPTRVILAQFPELRQLQRELHERDQRWVNLIHKQPEIAFQPYLQAILANEDYREWQEVYTPTTVEDRRRIPEQETPIASQRRFSPRLKLRVETVKPDKVEQRNQPDGVREPQERVEQWDVLAGLRNYAVEHVMLVGKPGSGKSTALERLLWEEAEKALQDPKARIPVLVKLRRCTVTIEALIRDFLVGYQVALEIAQIEELLRQGRFLLLLDGLNELPKAFETEVANFRDRYRHTTPMIVSTRDLGGGGTLGIEKTLKMLPLTESQMREFVRGYLGPEGDRLFQQLQGDRLRKFAETPLLLWMLCRVFADNGKVPDNLGLAFREFAQLHDQELQADAPAESKDQWHKLLRHLAFVMMQGKTALDPQLSIPKEEAEDCLTAYLQQEGWANPRGNAEQWLKDLLKYHLIQPVIQPNFEEHIEFRHQLIQEYYAAEYLLKLLPTLTDEQLKRDYLNYLKWTEPVVLMLALLEDEAQAVRVVKLALDVDLMLGAKLAGKVRSDLQEMTISLVSKRTNSSEWLEVELLGRVGSKHIVPKLEYYLQHNHFHVRERVYLAFRGISSMLHESYYDFFRQTALKEEGINRYFSISALNNNDVEDLEGIRNSLNDPDMATELKGACDPLIQKAATSEDFLDACLDAFQKGIQQSDNPGLCQMCIAFLILHGGYEVIPILIEGIKTQKSPSMKSKIAEAIQELGYPEFLPYLWQVILEDKGDVTWTIEQIQNRCKFYNYEIFQAHLAAQKGDRPASKTSDRSSPTIYNIDQVGIINTGHVSIHGDQIGGQNA